MSNQLQLPYLVESSIILALGYMIYRLVFASDKAYMRNRIYLLGLLVLSFVLPLISLPVFAQKIVAVPLKPMTTTTVMPSPMLAAESSFDWSILLYTIYLTGVVVLLFRLAYHILFINKVIRESEKITYNGIQYVITDKLTTPASIFNILLTDNTDLPQAVIDHEKVHMRHGHTWDVLILELVKSILWFNPFVYLTSRLLKENHEFIADYIASKSIQDESEYSYLLLQYAKSIQTPILLNTFSFITKKRIIMLSKETRNNPWKSLLIIPVVFGMISIFSCETYPVNINSEGDSVSEITGTRLDTTMTLDGDTGEELMTVQRVYLNEVMSATDTVTNFNHDTYEEVIEIVTREVPRKEVIVETYTAKEYNIKTGDLETNTYRRYPKEMVKVNDTITEFDFDTYEEKIVVITERAREELISTKVTPKAQIKEGQNYNNVVKEENKVTVKTKNKNK